MFKDKMLIYISHVLVYFATIENCFLFSIYFFCDDTLTKLGNPYAS